MHRRIAMQLDLKHRPEVVPGLCREGNIDEKSPSAGSTAHGMAIIRPDKDQISGLDRMRLAVDSVKRTAVENIHHLIKVVGMERRARALHASGLQKRRVKIAPGRDLFKEQAWKRCHITIVQ